MISRNRNRQAFTLIELLVVIAIIAILAAILFPVFAQAREKARAVSCLSNMKQLGLGFTMYSQDFDEKNPNGLNWSVPGGNGWAGQLYSYVKSKAVYACPDDSTANLVSSYAYNSNNTNPTGANVDSYTIALYNSPAKTILLSEVTGNVDPDNLYSVALDPSNPLSDSYLSAPGVAYNGQGGRSAAGYGLYINGAGYGYNGAPHTLKYATGYVRNSETEYYSQAAYFYYFAKAGRHTGGANNVMADDHAKFLMPSAVSAGVSTSDPTLCTGGYNVSGYVEAAGSQCSDSTIAATYSLQ